MQPRLFKEDGNADDFKKYLPVNVNTSFRTLAPYLGLAELNYINPLLGDELFDELATFYETNTAKDIVKYSQLLTYVKYSEIHLSYFLGWAVLSTAISDGGASTKADGDKRLYRYQEVAILESFKNNGFNILDTVLNYLHEHIDVFEAFKKSNFYSDAKKTLIPTTAMFNSIYNINNSRLVFLKMKQYIKLVEDIELVHHLGSEFVAELLNADLQEDKYNEFIEKIRNYIVYLSVTKGIGELKKLPTEKGLIFESSSDYSRDGYMQNPVEYKEIEVTLTFCKETAEAYLSSAKHYLNQHADDFPAFIEWAGKSSPETTKISRNNTGKKTVFI